MKSIKWIGLVALAIVLFIMDLNFPLLYDFNEIPDKVFQLFRLPRALTALFVGIGLSIAGLSMQVLFRNPLAGPSILGVNTGSTLMVALVLMTFTGTATFSAGVWDQMGSIVVLASIVGSLLVLGLIGLLSYFLRNNISLLITGILISYFGIAAVSLLQFFAKPEDLQSFIFWTFGSLEALNSSQVSILGISVLSVFLLLLLQSKRLNVFLLGTEYAQNLGLNLKRIKWLLILITAISTGIITAFCGPIGFIGLAVPHLARMLFKTNDIPTLLLASVLIGANMLLLSDLMAHVYPNYVLPINAVAAVLGCPVILFYVIQSRKTRLVY